MKSREYEQVQASVSVGCRSDQQRLCLCLGLCPFALCCGCDSIVERATVCAQATATVCERAVVSPSETVCVTEKVIAALIWNSISNERSGAGATVCATVSVSGTAIDGVQQEANDVESENESESASVEQQLEAMTREALATRRQLAVQQAEKKRNRRQPQELLAALEPALAALAAAVIVMVHVLAESAVLAVFAVAVTESADVSVICCPSANDCGVESDAENLTVAVTANGCETGGLWSATDACHPAAAKALCVEAIVCAAVSDGDRAVTANDDEAGCVLVSTANVSANDCVIVSALHVQVTAFQLQLAWMSCWFWYAQQNQRRSHPSSKLLTRIVKQVQKRL